MSPQLHIHTHIHTTTQSHPLPITVQSPALYSSFLITDTWTSVSYHDITVSITNNELRECFRATRSEIYYWRSYPASQLPGSWQLPIGVSAAVAQCPTGDGGCRNGVLVCA
ncbi:hypothetical protein K458DRAFT_22560 [Lentithecium fluviatile CBS 122367]|uniref:Uncharacterized protein n=1 Tax=Lentithecium fluviatile CBS 122367 TaxID=1168545 RepID=A0A6G1J458_9PLEO|nr:hypothetical protein K458DRAFT_22560 [Lentithecium fluviatile CBS 122367]